MHVLRYGTRCQGISQFYLHTPAFVYDWIAPYLPLPSQVLTDPGGMKG